MGIRRASNLYRYFRDTPDLICELDKKRFTKYELTRFLRVKYMNFKRLFTNPIKHLKFHHMVRISMVTGIPLGEVAEMFLRDMHNSSRAKEIIRNDLAKAREEAIRNHKYAGERYKRVIKGEDGEFYDPLMGSWDYEID